MRTVVIAVLLAACGSKGSKPAASKDGGVSVAAAKDAGAPDARPVEPDQATFLGDPYEDRAVPAGTLRVTLTRGSAKTPAPGVTLHLVSLDGRGIGKDVTFTTDAAGAFDATGLVHDGTVAYHVLGELDGDRLESAPITLRDQGVRLDLRARTPSGDGLTPFTGIPELDTPIPDGEAWVSVAATGDATEVFLLEIPTQRQLDPASVTQETLGPTARFTGLTPGGIYVAWVRHATGQYVSRPLLAMAGAGVSRTITAMERPMVRCATKLTRDRDALHGWTRCDLWLTGGIPRVMPTPLILPLPEGATKPDLRPGTAAQLDGGAVTWTGSVPPGLTSVDVEYTLAVTAGRADVAVVSAQALGQIGFQVEAGATIQVTDVTGGQYRAPNPAEGQDLHIVWADYTRAGDRLAFTITGATPPTPCELLGVARWTADGNPAPAPDVEAEASDGTRVKLSSLRGQPVVLNLFASWTPMSAEEVPSLTALSRVIGPLGAQLVVVASDPSWDDVKKLIDPASGMSVWLDRPKGTEYVLGDAAHAFGTTKLPETYLIDAEGLVRYWVVNARDWTSPDALACIQSLKTPWTGKVTQAPPPYVQPSVHLSGTIRLGNVAVPPGGMLFILARRVYDGVPVAAIKVDGPRFPQSFQMTDAELVGTAAFLGDVEVTARVDRDGDVRTEERGDVFGTAVGPTGSSNVQITIDQHVP